MEHWIEINLEAEVAKQNGILLGILQPYVKRLDKDGKLVTWHYFREPEIRFRVRLRSRAERKKQEKTLSRIADSLVNNGSVSDWHFGNHGEKGRAYTGEEDRYGKNGWKVAQDYFRSGAETALLLLELKRKSRLESPLWAKGAGNPWEGGKENPWRERKEDPLVYHWSREVHLLSNQMGFNMVKEAELCSKQAERYRQVVKKFGILW